MWLEVCVSIQFVISLKKKLSHGLTSIKMITISFFDPLNQVWVIHWSILKIQVCRRTSVCVHLRVFVCNCSWGYQCKIYIVGPSGNLVLTVLASDHQRLLAMRKMYLSEFGDEISRSTRRKVEWEWMLKYTDYLVETCGKKAKKIFDWNCREKNLNK